MKYKILLLFNFLFGYLMSQTGTLTDARDGKVYKTVVIGNSTWLSENLNTDKFRNGDLIPQAKSTVEWVKFASSKTPAWCYYNFDSKNGLIYGKMYNAYCMSDPRGLAPDNWHISTVKEWEDIVLQVNGNSSTLIAAPSYETTFKYVDVGGYNENIPCTKCNYWSDQQKNNNPCDLCRNTRYLKGKYIPKTKEKVEEKNRKGGWNGSDSYQLALLPGGAIFHDGSSGGIGTIDKFGYLNGSTYYWANNSAAQISVGENYIFVKKIGIPVNPGNGYYIRVVKGSDQEYLAEIKKNEEVALESTKKECENKGMLYDEATKSCVAKPVVIDPDVRELVEDMGRYRTILNGFYDPTGWIPLDSYTPNEYTPNFLSIDLLAAVTTEITELIKQKGSSSDFGSFIKMMKALKNAYNNDKFKGMFQKKVDPDGTDVFATIDNLITNITTEADKIKGSLGYDPLVSPTEKQIRDFVFRGQLRSVYKSGRLNLMMMVYTYTKGGESIKKDNNEVYGQIETYSNTVNTNRNFENCKNILDVYRQTYNDGVYDQPLLTKVKSEIQKCWCDKQYEDLGKVGLENMFDNEMKKGRKELISFLNGIGSSNKGEFAIILNSGVCKGIKIDK